MSSKTWTTVCVTLTLLVLGCSESDVARVPSTGNTVAATLPSNAAARPDHGIASGRIAEMHNLPVMPDDAGIEGPLEVPQNFAPPHIEMEANFPMSFGNSQILLPVVKGDSKSLDLVGFVDAHALKSLLSESTDVKLVRLKDKTEDIQVVALDATSVATNQGKVNLFGLPGFHDAKSVVDVSSASFAGQPLHGLDASNGPGFPFAGPAGGAGGDMPPMPGMLGTDQAAPSFPGLDGNGNPVNPEHMFEVDRDAQAPGANMPMPGGVDEHFGQLPGIPQGAELPELPQLGPESGGPIVDVNQN